LKDDTLWNTFSGNIPGKWIRKSSTTTSNTNYSWTFSTNNTLDMISIENNVESKYQCKYKLNSNVLEALYRPNTNRKKWYKYYLSGNNGSSGRYVSLYSLSSFDKPYLTEFFKGNNISHKKHRDFFCYFAVHIIGTLSN
jgi:hypothetical protein